MARLTIEQVKAPDFSASSEMMARANESFNIGIESAKGILGKYDQGQKAKNDSLILNDIAKLDSEEALNEYLSGDSLQGLNISDKMKETVLGLRNDVLGYAQDRAATSSTLDATSRANALEGRTAAEYIDDVAARTERRGMTGAVIDNAIEGRRYGLNGSSGGSSGVSADNPVFSEFMGTIQKAGVTNPYALAAIAATGSHESGFSEKNANGSWSDPSESGRPGTAGGVMSWNNERFQNMRYYTKGNLSGSAQAQFFLQEDPELVAALQNAGSAAEAQTLMNNAWRFAGYDRPGGEAGNRIKTAENLVGMFANGQNIPVTENASGGPANDVLRNVIKNSLYLEPDQALGLLETGYAAQKDGQALIDAAEARRQAETIAAATRNAILNPNNLSPDAVTKDLLSIDGVSSANALAAAGQDRSSFAGVIAPGLAPDSEANAALGRIAASDAAAAGNDPIARSFALAQTFNESEDVGGQLLSEFKIPKDSALNSESANRRIKAMAADAGVTPGEMAASLSQSSQGNSEQLERMLSAAEDEGIYATIISTAQDDFGDGAKEAYRVQQAENSARDAQRASAELQLSTARTRAAKAAPGSDARRAADAEVANLRDTILKGMTPQEREQNLVDYISKTGMGSRLQGLDPQSSEFFRAMSQLEETVRMDSTLTSKEKELLLKDIRG